MLAAKLLAVKSGCWISALKRKGALSQAVAAPREYHRKLGLLSESA
jgi:hypothetical protein